MINKSYIFSNTFNFNFNLCYFKGLNLDDSENDFNKNRHQLQLDLHNNHNYDVDFIIPHCNKSIGTKKPFLERHPIQPLESNGKQMHF